MQRSEHHARIYTDLDVPETLDGLGIELLRSH